MRSIVVYYSQTGNTKKIAQAIHAGTRQVIKESDIATVKETNPQELVGYDLIGLGGPVWFAREPVNVNAFIDGMVSSEGKHGFTFCTHGALPSGFMQSVIPALKRKGLTIIGFNDWYASCLYPALPKPYLTDGHPDEIDLKKAEDFGREMAERSRRIYSGETHLIPKLPTVKEWNKLYGRPLPFSNELAEARNMVLEQRKINAEKCTVCGLCVDNCPADGIDLSVSPPVFTSSCVACFFCEQLCPEGAIEVNFEPFVKIHDKYVRNWLNRRLNKAEALGRFRRLVALEDVGWDTHWYKITGHPRYVIEG